MTSGLSYGGLGLGAEWRGAGATFATAYPAENVADTRRPSMPAKITGTGPIFTAELEQRSLVGFVGLIDITATSGTMRVELLQREDVPLPAQAAWFLALDNSGSMGDPTPNGLSTRLATLKSAVGIFLEALKAAIVDDGAVYDIGAGVFGAPGGTLIKRAATGSDVDLLIAWVNAIDPDADNTDFVVGMDQAKDFFDATDAGFTDRRLLFLTDGLPTRDLFTSAAVIAGEAQDVLDTMPDVVSYGFNIDLSNTTYTAYIDNTPSDGVPVVSSDHPEDLADALLQALTSVYNSGAFTLWPAGSPAAGARRVRPFVLPTPAAADLVRITFTGLSSPSQIGAIEIGRFWSHGGLSNGIELGVDTPTSRIPLAGGGSMGVEGLKFRTVSGQLTYVAMNTAARTGLDFQKLTTTSIPLVYVDDYEAAALWPEQCIPVLNSDIPPSVGVMYRHDTFQLRLREIWQ